MAITGAELAVLKAVNKWAFLRESYIGVIRDQSDDFWTLADAANDETYENWCNGQEITDCDTALKTAAFGGTAAFAKWEQQQVNYITAAANAARPGLGYASWNAYLTALLWRVPWAFAELIFDRRAQRLAAISVGAEGIYSATIGDNSMTGLHDFGQFTKASTDTWVPNQDDLDTSETIGAPILYNYESSQASTEITATITAKKVDGSTKDWVGVTCAGGADVQLIVGERALTGASNAGQKVIASTNAATGDYVALDYALLYESDTLQEIVQIASLSNGVSFTTVANLRHTYSDAAVLWPLYIGVSAVTAASGTSGKKFSLYARPDRTLELY